MKKIIYFCLICLIQISCLKNENKKDIINIMKDEYPKEISEIKAFGFYDDAKWLFYGLNYHLNDFYNELYENVDSNKIKIVSLEAKFQGIFYVRDTVYISFCVQLNDSISCFSKDPYFFPTFCTLKNKLDTVLYRHPSESQLSPPTIIEDVYNDTLKYFEFYQYFKANNVKPIGIKIIEFEKYLQTTKDSINPWLRQEAIKRGVLKE